MEENGNFSSEVGWSSLIDHHFTTCVTLETRYWLSESSYSTERVHDLILIIGDNENVVKNDLKCTKLSFLLHDKNSGVYKICMSIWFQHVTRLRINHNTDV